MKELASLNKYLFRYKWYLVLGCVFVLLSNVFAILPAQIVRHAFDLISDTIGIYTLHKGFENQAFIYLQFKNAVLMYGFLIVLMALIRGAFLFLMRQTIIVMSRHIEYDLKNDIYAHYQELPLNFYRKNNTGDLMARISEDVGHLRMYLGPAIMYGISMVGTFALVMGYMLTVNVKLTLLSILPLPFLSIAIYYVSNLINSRSAKIQKQLSDLTTFVQQSFSGIRVVKAYTRENALADEFLDSSKHYKDESLKLISVNAMFFPLIISLIGLSTIITVYVGGLEVMNGTITAGNIAEFILYVAMLTWPVTSLGWTTSIIQRAAVSQKRINELMQAQNEIISTHNIKKEIQGHIVFDKVRFVYPDSGIVAIQELDFEIKHNQSLAILGTTGSGKSTIANLLCRMYDVSEGKIKIDGTDIAAYEVSYLRSQIGYVPQDVFLFSDTIRNNIAFGFNEGEFSEDTIIQAAKDADLLENIQNFPNGFHTELGERGITLSGGQKQRLSIARAIIRNPQILILDDCLSAVDTKTENIILNNLQRIMKGRTTVIISQRVSSAKLADKILLLDNGKIVEEGTHEFLLAKNGVYKELYDKQLQAEKEQNT